MVLTLKEDKVYYFKNVAFQSNIFQTIRLE